MAESEPTINKTENIINPIEEMDGLREEIRQTYNNLDLLIRLNGLPSRLGLSLDIGDKSRDEARQLLGQEKENTEFPRTIQRGLDIIEGMESVGITENDIDRLRIIDGIYTGKIVDRKLTVEDVKWFEEFIRNKVEKVYQYLIDKGYERAEIIR